MPDYSDRSKQEPLEDQVDLSKASFSDSGAGNGDGGWGDLEGPAIDRDAEREKIEQSDDGGDWQDGADQRAGDGSGDAGEDAWQSLDGPAIDREAERKNRDD